MGADQSALQKELVPQQDPICAVEPRFVLPRVVQLKIKEKIFSLSGDGFKISDPNDGTVYFRCAGKAFSLREKKTLMDNQEQPVLNMKEALMSFNDKFSVYAGNNSDRLICKFRTQWGIKAKMYAEFTDVQTGAKRMLVLKGDWRSKVALIYAGEPKQGGAVVAKIYRPLTGKSYLFGTDEYVIDIAPGVDISIIVIMCIALDEHKRDKD